MCPFASAGVRTGILPFHGNVHAGETAFSAHT